MGICGELQAATKLLAQRFCQEDELRAHPAGRQLYGSYHSRSRWSLARPLLTLLVLLNECASNLLQLWLLLIVN